MPIESEVAAREAKHGEKMIELNVRFWTDEIAPDKGKILPKHAWAAGVVRVKTNKSHELRGSDSIPFNSLLELGAAIEKALIDNEIVLHTNSTRMARYLSAE